MDAIADPDPAIERAALCAQLAEIADDTNAEAARAAVLARLKEVLAEGHAAVRRDFEAGAPGTAVLDSAFSSACRSSIFKPINSSPSGFSGQGSARR